MTDKIAMDHAELARIARILDQVARLFRWWPRYRVAPALANPAYLAVYLAGINGSRWGLR